MIDSDTLSILVVDDMKSMRLTIRNMLKNLNIGKTLHFAENGKEGLAILKETPCDLAIIDWNMPVMTGSEMLNHLRNDKTLRDIPVIMVTAENERDIVAEVAEIEIDGYLLKPLTPAALDRKIRQVIENANNPDPTTRHLLLSRELEEKGQISDAIEQVRLALVHKPSASRILRKMGMLHFKIDKPAVGEKCLHKAISVNPQDTASRVFLADYYLEKKEYLKASELFLQIISLSTRHFEKAVTLGRTLMFQGHTGEALEIFSRVIKRSGKNFRIREDIIDICLRYREFDFPKQLMQELLQENPSNQEILFKSGELYRDTGETEKAIECFKAVDSLKKGDVSSKMEIARLLCQSSRILQADDYLNQILRIDPGNTEALILRREL